MSDGISRQFGYALIDLCIKDGKVVDERIDPQGFLAVDYPFSEEWNREGFLRFCREACGTRQQVEAVHAKPLDARTPAEAELIENQKMMLSFECKLHGNWNPSDNVMIDRAGGFLLVSAPGEKWSRQNDMIDVIEGLDTPSIQYVYPRFVESTLGPLFAGSASPMEHSILDYQMNIPAFRPPCAVGALCRYMRLFSSEKTILDLRPVIYTFWS